MSFSCRPSLSLLSASVSTVLLLIAGNGLCSAPADSSGLMAWSDPSWVQFLKVMFLLAVVIALIWICLALLRRTMGMRGGAGRVQMAGGISLGARRSIQFVRIGRLLYLVGVTDHHISLLDTIDNPDEIENITKGDASRSDEPFAALFRRIVRKKDGQNAG